MIATGITGAMEGVNLHSAAWTVKTGDEFPFSEIMKAADSKNTSVTDETDPPRFRPESSKEVIINY